MSGSERNLSDGGIWLRMLGVLLHPAKDISRLNMNSGQETEVLSNRDLDTGLFLKHRQTRGSHDSLDPSSRELTISM